jgi:hypothetical protein
VQDVPDMRRMLAALVVATATVVVVPAAAPAAVSAAEGYRQTAATVYRLDPANGRLRVTVTIKVTNRTPDRVESYPCVKYSGGWFAVPYPATCSQTTRYYMTTTSALVENEASAIKATSGGRTLAVTRGTAGAAYRAVSVTFPELFYGQTRTVKLTYTLRGGKPRSETTTRTLRAFASFCAIANGEDAGTVTVRVPRGFRLTASGEELASRVAGKERVLASGKVTDTRSWYACFTGTNAGGYRTQSVAAHAGRTIVLRSWPEDPAWASGVRADVVSSLPLLERLAGTGLAGTGLAGEASIHVQEAATGAEYAGFYDAKTGTITVGEDFGQPALVEHELAHAWFNRSTVKDTWLAEGLAEWAGRAVSGEAPACERPDVPDGSLDLDEWRYLQPRATAEAGRGGDAVRAACHVVPAAAAPATRDDGSSVRAAGAARPYAADPGIPAILPPSCEPGRYLEGLVGRRGRAGAGRRRRSALASDLLVAYGVAEDLGLLDDRAAARLAYRELVATTGGRSSCRRPCADGVVAVPRGVGGHLAGTANLGCHRRHGCCAGGGRCPPWTRRRGLGQRHEPHGPPGRRAARRSPAGGRARPRRGGRAPGRAARHRAAAGLFGTSVPSLDGQPSGGRAGDGDALPRSADIRATRRSAGGRGAAAGRWRRRGAGAARDRWPSCSPGTAGPRRRGARRHGGRPPWWRWPSRTRSPWTLVASRWPHSTTTRPACGTSRSSSRTRIPTWVPLFAPHPGRPRHRRPRLVTRGCRRASDRTGDR